MWIYNQVTGALRHNNSFIETGYSGAGVGKNNPQKVTVKNVGPIPIGMYTLGTPVEETHMGPLAIPLDPDTYNEMYGRGGFYVHGDDSDHTASEGCIIMSRATRDKLVASDDNVLVVV